METAYSDGTLTEVVNFPYDEIDRGNPLAAELEATPWDFILSEPRAKNFLHRLSRVVYEISQMPNSKLYAEAFLIAIGDEAQGGRGMTETAKRHSVSKAAVSHACVWWCNYLGKKPSQYMMSTESKESFVKSNQRKTKV